MFLLRIDFSMLQSRLSLLERRPMTSGDVMAWLLEREFQTTRSGWVAPGAGLQSLEIREIIFSHPIHDAPAT
jgi:hypothetical protein